MVSPLTPTAQVPKRSDINKSSNVGQAVGLPLFTASRAYSTWKTWPSGLKTAKV
jgi:hypothetical protein